MASKSRDGDSETERRAPTPRAPRRARSPAVSRPAAAAGSAIARARSSPCTTSAAQSAPCAACWSPNRCDSRELVTKRTIGAGPLPNRNRVRPPRSVYVDILLGRRCSRREERPSLPCRRRLRARAPFDEDAAVGLVWVRPRQSRGHAHVHGVVREGGRVWRSYPHIGMLAVSA